MAVGKAVVASLRQPPVFPWPSAALKLVLTRHEARSFELEQMLTRAGGSHAKARPDIGGGLGSARLQVKQDAIRTALLVLTHDDFNLMTLI